MFAPKFTPQILNFFGFFCSFMSHFLSVFGKNFHQNISIFIVFLRLFSLGPYYDGLDIFESIITSKEFHKVRSIICSRESLTGRIFTFLVGYFFYQFIHGTRLDFHLGFVDVTTSITLQKTESKICMEILATFGNFSLECGTKIMFLFPFLFF